MKVFGIIFLIVIVIVVVVVLYKLDVFKINEDDKVLQKLNAGNFPEQIKIGVDPDNSVNVNKFNAYLKYLKNELSNSPLNFKGTYHINTNRKINGKYFWVLKSTGQQQESMSRIIWDKDKKKWIINLKVSSELIIHFNLFEAPASYDEIPPKMGWVFVYPNQLNNTLKDVKISLIVTYNNWDKEQNLINHQVQG